MLLSDALREVVVRMGFWAASSPFGVSDVFCCVLGDKAQHIEGAGFLTGKKPRQVGLASLTISTFCLLFHAFWLGSAGTSAILVPKFPSLTHP